ncbi:MAG: DUF917 domain-containing protein [Rhizomicrobium sp.]
MRSRISVQDVEDVAVGGAILGTGGGGDPYVGKLMAQRAIEEFGPPEMIPLREIPDNKIIMVAAGIGAPTVLVEKILRGDEAVTVFKALQNHLGKKAYAVMSAEVGGVNGTIPIAVAARLKIPVVDADCMGRAFPEVQLVIPQLYGVSATPLIIADEKGNSAVLSTIDNAWTEVIARAVASKMGGIALMALYTMDGKTAKRATLPSMLSFTLRIGKTLRIARQRKLDIISELLKVTHGVRLFKGKIVDLDRRTDRGHVRGEVIIQGSDDFGGQTLNMQFQNENLVARSGEKVLATVPDLITVVDQDTCFPITTEGLKYGLRVTVIGIPCHKKWRTRAGIALAGPHHFGYDVPYQPIAANGGTRRSHASSARN